MYPTDIKVIEAESAFIPYKARTPLKFGAVVMPEALFFRARVKVENRAGSVAEGYGGIFLADFWAWPSANVAHQARELAMRRLSEEYTKLVSTYNKYAHPIDIYLETEADLKRLSHNIIGELNLPEPMPYLAALVCASPVDAALHDAFGNVNGMDTYLCYGKDFMSDLSKYLGKSFKDKYISDYLRPSYLPEVPVFHLVGGLDKLRRSEVDESCPKDNLPNCLEDWIERDGIFCLKVKLRGTDLYWDLNRLIEVYQVSIEGAKRHNRAEIFLTADTNEQCDTPEYMIELLNKLKEASVGAFNSLLYIEQPTHRDLREHPFDFHRLSAIKPVFVDESLTDFEMFDLAVKLGCKGIALKSCKGQSMCMLFVAKATEENIPYAVQDLTNPGIALIHSIGLAARIYTVKGVEANSRQFFPRASDAERKVHRDLIDLKDGLAKTHSLQGSGLGYQMAKILGRCNFIRM